jgi:peptide-methionine (R)-S-oxide reductase
MLLISVTASCQTEKSRKDNQAMEQEMRKGEFLTWGDVMRYARKGSPPPDHRVEKSDADWRSLLTEEEYQITRQKGTERAFTGAYCESFVPGRYACRCCGTALFDAEEKFESGTGWPSFTQPLSNNVVKYEVDKSFGMVRVEILCNVCDAHLGHVFPDGPGPGGLRFCTNSASLRRIETGTNESN